MAAHLAQAVDVSEIPSVCSILLNAARMGGSGLVASASDACGAVHQIRNHTYWCADLEEQVTCMACRSPKIDRIVFRAARHTQPVNHVRRSAVHRIGPPALNGVGNQTNGRRHRTRGLAARTLHLGTNPPIAQRKSPRTVRARLREHPLPCHIPESGRLSAQELSHVA